MQKPTKPVLDGLSSEEKQAALKEFQQATKDFYAQVQQALKDCKAKIQSTQQDFRERVVSIKEQCSNTERTVLGLSTEVPYNADPAVPMQ
jgi:adenine-specific DNA methylase